MTKRAMDGSTLSSQSGSKSSIDSPPATDSVRSLSHSVPLGDSSTSAIVSSSPFPVPGSGSVSRGAGAEGIMSTTTIKPRTGTLSSMFSTNSANIRPISGNVISSSRVIRSSTISPVPSITSRFSPNGLCGVPFGYVCEGSLFGDCCGSMGFW